MIETDRDIKNRLMDRLGWDARIDPSELRVGVENGAVTLAGQVETHAGRLAAMEAAWFVPGVREVRDQLSVRRREGADVLPTDAEVRERVSNLIAWNPSLHEKDIHTKVAGGIVTLQGSVDAHWKRQAAEDVAAGVLGVVEVRNHLTVVPADSIADRALAREVVSALERSAAVDATCIEVSAEEGIVTLSGKVSSPATRRAAEEAASRTTGVVEVRNDVEVVLSA